MLNLLIGFVVGGVAGVILTALIAAKNAHD